MVGTGSREPLPVLFLWHHHQPFYQAPGSPLPLLPWVRLHAVRGYVDMISVLKQTGAAATVNFSPSLLEQLRFASDTTPSDEFERVSRIPAGDLTEDERRLILANFFSISWAVNVKPHPRYSVLLGKRGEQRHETELRRALVEFSTQDISDLIALFNLAWIGFSGKRDPRIAELMKKQHDYTYEDIRGILDYHHETLSGIIDDYKSAYRSGQIEISTSPFSHAILPLLCNSSVAAPDIHRHQLPKPDYRHPDDTIRQLKLAWQNHVKTWDQEPAGLWPSEGSVSDEALDLAANTGFVWAATDQGILERSEKSGAPQTDHFASYEWHGTEKNIRLYFRDRGLSDSIGFRYAAMNPTDAVNEFVFNLERVADGTKDTRGRCLVIALDGENPWESYPDGGEQFLIGLYRTIQSSSNLRLTTFARHAQIMTQGCIHRIHAGSWIESNFRIWIGDPQKNQAWIELGRARALLEDLPIGDERRDECWKWMLRAQGSDWLWWYGDPFTSDYQEHFDELFRSFLREIYRAAGAQPPPSLNVPLAVPPRDERRIQPAFPIVPVIDGRESSFYEWVGACRINPRQYGAAMDRSEHLLHALYYGFGEHEAFFRFDPAATLRPIGGAKLVLHVVGQRQTDMSILLEQQSAFNDESGLRWVSGPIVEVAIPFSKIGLSVGSECQFWIELLQNDLLLEQLPPSGAYRFIVPTPEHVAANWIV